MIINGEKYFILNTDNTTYAIRITPSGHLEHMYYGKRIRVVHSLDGLYERQEFMMGNNNSYSPDFPALTLNNLCMEVSFEGKGDNREAMLVAETPSGIRTNDFLFESAVVDNTKIALKTMPSSYSDSCDHLAITLVEKYLKLRLILDYYVFEEENVITRSARLINEGEEEVYIDQFYSAQLDLHDSKYLMSTFNGAWAREMMKTDTPLTKGKHVNSSFSGTSSSTANPFFMISEPDTTEDHWEVVGCNLIYSGNHAEVAEVNEFNKTRILWGINPRAFSWTLGAGEEFETPEAVMTFSDEGYNGMSVNMHAFVRNHVTRGEWAAKPRPVLLNSWEAAYFDINESKLLKLAKAGRDVGIELFVMDDGWFGKRNDDHTSLGDWTPNKKKLPHGVKGIADKINRLGMSFGIWVEPEMVNVDSELYRAHPDWTISIPGHPHSEGRNQRMLDLSRTEVQNYIIESMSEVFSSGNIEYVKWDMNRTLTDIYSAGLEAVSESSLSDEEKTENNSNNGKNKVKYKKHRQGELMHRYQLGLYRCMKTLTEKFPHILFEGCASGGNRFDLGILSYFPQIWGSDDTDAIMRAEIQSGYSYGYPQSCWGSHVSGVPNHQTLRVTPLESRYAVAAFGCLGYECNLRDMSKEELSEIKEQIKYYKEYRNVFQFGQLYRGRSFSSSDTTEWTVVSPDKSEAVGMIIHKNAVPNSPYQYYKAKGLGEDKYYRFYNREIKINIKQFGDLVNMVSPVHVRPGSAFQDMISKVYKLEGDRDDLKMFGSAMMNAGVKLMPTYAGTGFNNKTMVYPDFGARVYYIREESLDET